MKKGSFELNYLRFALEVTSPKVFETVVTGPCYDLWAEYLTHGLCKLLGALDADWLPGAVHACELLVEHLALQALLVVLDVPHVVPVGHLGPHDVPGAAILVLGDHLDLVG